MVSTEEKILIILGYLMFVIGFFNAAFLNNYSNQIIYVMVLGITFFSIAILMILQDIRKEIQK